MIADFYAHLRQHHGFEDPEVFAAAARERNRAAGADLETGTGRSTRAMLEAIAEAAASRSIVVVAPGGDPVAAADLGYAIADLQTKLGIVALPITTTNDPDDYPSAEYVIYRDHGATP